MEEEAAVVTHSLFTTEEVVQSRQNKRCFKQKLSRLKLPAAAALIILVETISIIIIGNGGGGSSSLVEPTTTCPAVNCSESSSSISMDSGHAFPLAAPFRMVVAGPSSCGKTTFVKKLITYAKRMILPPPTSIFWYYSQWQNWYHDMASHITFVRGIPPKLDCSSGRLIVLDDLFQELNQRVVKLFTCDSHHSNVSVIFITQNIFDKNPHQRTLSLNASYLVLFKNPRDSSQINYLARQMYPDNAKFMIDAFRQSTSAPFSYLFVDLTQSADDRNRLRTDIFPDEQSAIFVPRK